MALPIDSLQGGIHAFLIYYSFYHLQDLEIAPSIQKLLDSVLEWVEQLNLASVGKKEQTLPNRFSFQSLDLNFMFMHSTHFRKNAWLTVEDTLCPLQM